jgi:hypothetical protein
MAYRCNLLCVCVELRRSAKVEGCKPAGWVDAYATSKQPRIERYIASDNTIVPYYRATDAV